MTRLRNYRGHPIGGQTANKYGAVKRTLNGHTFDSIAESEYYLLLLSRQQSGEIRDIILQPKYELQARCILPDRQTVVPPIDYTADFQVTYPDGKVEAIDVKGRMTKDASMRIRMFRVKYPDIPLRVVKKERGEWVVT